MALSFCSSTSSCTPITVTPTINNYNYHLFRPFFPFSIKHLPLRPPLLPKPTTLSTSLPPPLTAFAVSASSTSHLRSPEDPISTRGQQAKEKIHESKEEEEREWGGSATAQWFQLLDFAIRRRDLQLGRLLHAVFTRSCLEEYEEEATHLLTMLISFYAKVGRLRVARTVFEKMPVKDVVAYSTLIASYAKCGMEEEAAKLFSRMRMSDVDPNHYTFVAALSACTGGSNFRFGSALHALAVKTNHCADVYVSNALMASFIKDHRLDDAVRVFDSMPARDVTSWNTIMSGMVKESRYGEVLELFHDMRMEGFAADRFTLSSLSTATEKGCFPDHGLAIHAHGIKMGLELDLSVANALISCYTDFGHVVDDVVDIFERMPTRDVISWTGMLNGYMKFGKTDLAMEVFKQMPVRNSITYNSLLAGFCHNGCGDRAIDIFRRMVKAGMELSDHTLSSAVNACALRSDLEKSRQMHAFVIKVGCESNPWVKAALLDMCIKCDRVEDAKKMLDRWPREKDYLIAWTSMVSGYVQNGQPDEALSLFDEVAKEEGLVSVDEVALSAVLEICGALGFVGMGKQMHCHAIKSGDVFDVAVGNAILSMYSECGRMDDALKIFKSMGVHDIISWNALLMAHVIHRQGDEALVVWKKMERMGVYPDELSFLFIISACKYTSSDSVSICRSLFASMMYHGIKPSEEHYASFVEVLCQRDLFHEAEESIKDMPIKPGAIVWRALLNSCRLRSNLTLGRRAMQQILALRPADPSTFVLISNIYSSSGRWHCSDKIREEMQEMGLHKRPAESWIVDQHKRHTFYTRDRSHLQQKDVYGALNILILECMKAGYVPDTSFVLHEVEEYQKKDFLFYHSAKLAVAYGILIAAPGKPIWAMKNIRLCGDCHSFFKYVSLVTGREIMLRDATGFHRFKCRKCTCGDYW